MPFTFIDIERKQSRKIIPLFLTLAVFYFTGMLLLYFGFVLSFGLAMKIELLRHPHPYVQFSTAFGLLPSWQTTEALFIIALVAALVHWALSMRNMVEKILRALRARPIDPEDRYHLLLKNIIDEISIATGGLKIEPYVVSSRYLNAFALSDFKGRSVIGITEGLLTRLNRNQLEGVIAHEAAHLVWGDCITSTVTCSVAGVYAALFRHTLDMRTQSFPVVPFPLLPLVFIIFLLKFLTLFMSTLISREREIRADATAVRFTRDPFSLAEALYLMSNNRSEDALADAELAPIFIVNPRERKLEESYGLFSDLFSTHPPIKQRLAVLLEMAHSNHAILESGIKEKPKIQEEIPFPASEGERLWHALNEKCWQGPYRLDELAHLKWLGPFTWVTRPDDMQVKSAFEYKEINDLINHRIPDDSRIHTCPACSLGLEQVYNEGVPIWKCLSCKGRLIHKDRLFRIMARERTVFSSALKEKAKQIRIPNVTKKAKYMEVSPSSLKCPSCGDGMHRTLYAAILPYRMEIDICQNCHLYWLDKDELEILEYVIRVL
jgi:heat shock protein HtpX